MVTSKQKNFKIRNLLKLDRSLKQNKLDNKAQEVNSRLINMCGERNITFVDHIDTIETKRHLNERKVPLNKSGTIEIAKNVLRIFIAAGLT